MRSFSARSISITGAESQARRGLGSPTRQRAKPMLRSNLRGKATKNKSPTNLKSFAHEVTVVARTEAENTGVPALMSSEMKCETNSRRPLARAPRPNVPLSERVPNPQCLLWQDACHARCDQCLCTSERMTARGVLAFAARYQYPRQATEGVIRTEGKMLHPQEKGPLPLARWTGRGALAGRGRVRFDARLYRRVRQLAHVA
jgi:hypothetical protein